MSLEGKKRPLVPSKQKSIFISDDDSHKFSFFGFSPAMIAIVSSIAWMAVSSGLILLNKSILSNGFPYPMALSSLGMCFSSVASYITCHHLKLVKAKKVVSWHFYLTRMLPVGLCMALTLHFGNLAYLHLTVSFIQILKSISPVITMLALFLAQLETPTRQLVMSVMVITIGTAIASISELNLSALGVFIMLSNEVFESIRLVMTQLLLSGLKFHPIEGLMYLAPACCFWQAIGLFILEFRAMVETEAFYLVAAQPMKFCLAAGFGFVVNSIGYIIIQTASSLSLKVLGTVKNALVIWLGVFLLGDTVTSLQAIGYSISLSAFCWYQKIKMEQLNAGRRSPPTGKLVKEKSAMFDGNQSKKILIVVGLKEDV